MSISVPLSCLITGQSHKLPSLHQTLIEVFLTKTRGNQTLEKHGQVTWEACFPFGFEYSALLPNFVLGSVPLQGRICVLPPFKSQPKFAPSHMFFVVGVFIPVSQK